MALALNKPFSLESTSETTEEMVDFVRNYIDEHDCPELFMDISNLNIIDASKVTILCSTYHWAKYPQGHLKFQTSSKEVNELVKSLNLGNISLETV